MVMSTEAAQRGDADAARAHADEADKYFDLALQYYRDKYPNDQNMTASALVEQRMDALLAGGQLEKACQFAAESISANRGNQELMGRKLRNEADRLAAAKRYDDALRLIDGVNKMSPELKDPFRGQIRSIEQSVRQQLSAQRGAANVASPSGGGAAAAAAAGEPVGAGQ